MANLTFSQMQDKAIANAFNEGNRSDVQVWLNDYYRRVWGLVDWPFRKPEPASLTVTAGDATPTMPTDIMRVVEVMDNNENPLSEINQEQYDQSGFLDTSATGKPSVYWLDGRQIRFGPIPDGSYTFQIRYERGLTHRNAAGTAVAGPMTLSDDQLFWDGFEYLIIFGARAMGKVLTNNPTWPGDVDQADAMLLDMMAEWFPPGNQPTQYGRDMLGYR